MLGTSPLGEIKHLHGPPSIHFPDFRCTDYNTAAKRESGTASTRTNFDNSVTQLAPVTGEQETLYSSGTAQHITAHQRTSMHSTVHHSPKAHSQRRCSAAQCSKTSRSRSCHRFPFLVQEVQYPTGKRHGRSSRPDTCLYVSGRGLESNLQILHGRDGVGGGGGECVQDG